MIAVIAWAGLILVGLLLLLSLWGGIVWLAVRYFPKRTARVLGLPYWERRQLPMPPALSDRQLPDCPPR